MKRILVTGGLGYIGTHVALELARRGHAFDVIDRDSSSLNKELVRPLAKNLWHEDLVDPLFRKALEGYSTVIHLAASISVEESTRDPISYWKNNLGGTISIPLQEVNHFIFASTGAVFNPTNPYATSKASCERYILDAAKAMNFGQTIFRFFNVSGLSTGVKQTGQPTHLIRLAALAAKGMIPTLQVFGRDYQTRDGTTIRDYIHVEDVAASIVNCFENGPANSAYECLGTGHGFTVLEVISCMEKVTGKRIKINFSSRRPGDAETLVCPSRYSHSSTNRTLEEICLSAFQNCPT